MGRFANWNHKGFQLFFTYVSLRALVTETFPSPTRFKTPFFGDFSLCRDDANFEQDDLDELPDCEWDSCKYKHGINIFKLSMLGSCVGAQLSYIVVFAPFLAWWASLSERVKRCSECWVFYRDRLTGICFLLLEVGE